MRKPVLQATVLLCLLLTGLYFSRSQQTPPSAAYLRNLYSEAQLDYDSATRLARRKSDQLQDEQKEEALNAKALKKFQLLYPQIPKTPWFDSLRFQTAFKVGELQHYFENFADAVSFYKAAIEIKKDNRLPDSLFFKPYLYSGIIFYNQNKFDSALQAFAVAESIQKRHNDALQEGERLYNIVGVLYYERGNYRQAENYFKKAIEVLRPDHEAYENLYVNYHINLAQIFLKLEEYDKANEIYQRLLPMNKMTNEIYHNVGSLNLALGAAGKALSYFKKISPAYNKTIRLYNSMGNAFFTNQQYDSAYHYYQKAIQAYRSLGKNSDPVGYGLALKSLGAYAVYLGQNDSAVQYYQQALRQFYPSFDQANVQANPETFSGVFSYINLFNTLVAKAEAWRKIFESTNNLDAARSELSTYQSAFRLIAYVERTYESDEARLFLAKIKYSLHSRPVDLAFELYRQTKGRGYLEALYFFDQQNKATALALSRQVGEETSAVNSPLLKKEEELKSTITLFSIRASQVTDSAQLAVLNQTIRNNEILLSKVQEQVNQQTRAKEASIPSIEQLQQRVLDETTALVSYHLSESKLTVLTITKTHIDCLQRDLPPNFAESFNAFLSALKAPNSQQLGQSNFYYDLFFNGVPLEHVQHLIIVPDDVLNYLPFEALQNKNGAFLIERFSVQYQYSSALLEKEKDNVSGAGVLSLAPFTTASASEGFPPLLFSRQEVEDLKGKTFFDTAATKKNFLTNCASYKVVHLATHAVVNSSQEALSYIAFSPAEKDNLLYAQEIYNLPLRGTQLVLLSACETASGQLIKGEGVMSLSRAFRYAGCANIVTTLWKANDFSTAYLTGRIHDYLQKGLPISEAMQQAKKDYLADRTVHPRLKQPYYWSHLVFIGNVQEQKTFGWWWLSGGILLVMLAVFSSRKILGRRRRLVS